MSFDDLNITLYFVTLRSAKYQIVSGRVVQVSPETAKAINRLQIHELLGIRKLLENTVLAAVLVRNEL
jgi:hypothetical protein